MLVVMLKKSKRIYWKHQHDLDITLITLSYTQKVGKSLFHMAKWTLCLKCACHSRHKRKYAGKFFFLNYIVLVPLIEIMIKV